MEDDLMEKRAERVSKLFPPCKLAYSFLLKSNNYKLSIDELYEQIMKYPNVPDSRKIFISSDDTKLFDFQDVNLFQISLEKFINFQRSDLIQVLNNFYFNVSQDGVCIFNPPEININQTLLVYRHLYPQMTNQEIYNEISKPIFIAYFHLHKLDINESEYPIPELQSAESFYYFNQNPTPEQALLSIFCSNRTDQMKLIDILKIKRNTQIFVGPEKIPQSLNTAIGDIISLIQNSNIFNLDDDTIQCFPPLILTNYFDCDSQFAYRPNDNPCLIRSPFDDSENEDDQITSQRPHDSNTIYQYIERLLEGIDHNVPNFTFLQIFQHVTAQIIGCDQFIFGENEISIEDIKNSIAKWISENAEVDFISNIQGSENSAEMLEERRKNLLDLQFDRRNDDLMSQMLEEYPFLNEDSQDVEMGNMEISQEHRNLYKLKGE